MIKNELCEKLCETMEKEVKLFEELLNKSNSQKEALVKMDVGRIENEFTSQENLCNEIAIVEKDRRSLFEEIKEYLNLSAEMKLKDIIKFAGEPYKTRLNFISARMQDLSRTIRKVTELNQELTIQGLEHSRFMLRLIATGGAEGIRTYDRDGETKEKPPVVENRIIDRTV